VIWSFVAELQAHAMKKLKTYLLIIRQNLIPYLDLDQDCVFNPDHLLGRFPV
jgi:hypothetical protein